MSHEITEKDTGWVHHKPAWHGLFDVGKKRPKTIRDARKVSGLTWDVKSVPFITLPQLDAILPSKGGTVQAKQVSATASEFATQTFRAIIRDDTLDVLGVATEDYEPIRNAIGFEWMEALLGETRFESLFSMRGGRQVCLLSEFPDWIEVGGDAVRQFLYARLDHTGSGSMQTMTTNVKVVCANTDRMAVDDAQARDGIYRIRHMGDVNQRLQEARKSIEISIDYSKQFKKFGDRLARQKFTERKLADVVAELWPAGQSDRAIASAERRRDLVLSIFKGEGPAGDTSGNAPGSKWCAYNAITEYEQHYATVRGTGAVAAERRFVRATDDPQGTQARALALIAGTN